MTATCTHPIEPGSSTLGLCHSEIQFRNRSLAAYRRCEYAERFLPTLAVGFWVGLFFILNAFCGMLIGTPVSIGTSVVFYYSLTWADIHWHAGKQHPHGRRGYRRLRRTERILRNSFEHARKKLMYGEHLFADEQIHIRITEAGATLTLLPTACWPQGLTLFYSCSTLSNDFTAMRASNLVHFDNAALLAIRQVAAVLFRAEGPEPPTTSYEMS